MGHPQAIAPWAALDPSPCKPPNKTKAKKIKTPPGQESPPPFFLEIKPPPPPSCAQLQMTQLQLCRLLLLCPRNDHQFPSAAWPCASASEFPPPPEPEPGDTPTANAARRLVCGQSFAGFLQGPRRPRRGGVLPSLETGLGELEADLADEPDPSCGCNALNARLGLGSAN